MNKEPQLGQVIGFVPRRQSASAVALAAVRSYWEGLRDGRCVPRRSQIDPRGMEDILEFAFILERVPQGAARFRLAGLHLCDLAGMEVRGMPLTGLIRDEDRLRCHTVTEQVFSAPAIVEMHLLPAGSDKGIARLLMMPLTNDEGTINRAFGALVHSGPLPQEPALFEILSVRTIALGVNAPIEHLGLAEAQKPFHGQGRSHLRLITKDASDHPAEAG